MIAAPVPAGRGPAGPRPALVATDLDGTLLRSDGTLSPRTLRALRAVEEAGVELVVVTGRPPRWLAPVVDAAGLTGVGIAANGALVIDLVDGSVRARHDLDPAAAAELLDLLRVELPQLAVAAEYGVAADGVTFGREPGYRSRYPLPPGALVAPADQLLARPMVKLLLRSEGTDADTLLELATKIAAHLPLTITHSGGIGLLEISAAGCDKASALAGVAAGLGVSREQVVAFGDMPNDVPMLRWAGRGIAVGSGHELALAAADEVCAGNDDDGVARCLEQWFGG